MSQFKKMALVDTATLDELTKLQDSVEAFDTKVAVEQIEKEYSIIRVSLCGTSNKGLD